MAFIEFQCGPCESGMQIDSSENEWLDGLMTLLAQRFVDAHVKCGFATSGVNAEDGPRSSNVVRLKTRHVDTDDEGDTL